VTASLRVFFVGGLTSYRALFNWLTPWILIPTFLVSPLVHVLLFASVGRTAGVGDGRFFLIGNAVQYAAIPCLFAMGNTIGNERQSQTLSLILVSPARRVPLFLGRSLPIIVNGMLVTAFTLGIGALLLQVSFPTSSLAPLALVVTVAAFSCTGLGLLNAAIALRVREVAVLSNVFFGVLLIFSGVNVPLSAMPAWMVPISECLPMTHAIAAARSLASGASLTSVGGQVLLELTVGAVNTLLGLGVLSYLENESRRRATLELA
jgi:ABC-2 type transport system permease protein